MRFRRSVKLAPGLRLNFSGSGMSVSAGPRGASVSFGKRGTYLNSGIPGTGLYSRTRLDAPPSRSSTPGREMVSVTINATVLDDGTFRFTDAHGEPLSDYAINKAKQQQASALRGFMEQKCDEINAATEALGEIHRHTPSPDAAPTYVRQPFEEPIPLQPALTSSGFWGFLFRSVRERVERENQQTLEQHESATRTWQGRKDEFDKQQGARRQFIEQDILVHVSAMEQWLEENLGAIEWPRETLVSFDVSSDGCRASIDVDLPEIEDMPKKTASMPARGYKLSIKDMTTTQVQRLYMRHVHGVGFRIIGEVFADLQRVNEVVLSAYSQRVDPATAQVHDDYLYSVRVTREQWARISFDNLDDLDVVEALSRFELRREMTKAGKLKSVEPITL
jgi:hypothetical protein